MNQTQEKLVSSLDIVNVRFILDVRFVNVRFYCTCYIGKLVPQATTLIMNISLLLTFSQWSTVESHINESHIKDKSHINNVQAAYQLLLYVLGHRQLENQVVYD